MSLASFIRAMPKVELHVHLVGSIRPETLLTIARRNGVTLPADSVEGLRAWYRFTGFDHFIEVYLASAQCIVSPDDIETITREFLAGQAAQNIRYTEFTHTPWLHYQQRGMTFEDQLAAMNRARLWAERELGVRSGIVIDIPRMVTPEEGEQIADWVIAAHGDGVIAFGLGGPEVGYPPERFTTAFERVRAAGIPAVPHAGETVGPESIWGALKALGAVRIGHGFRCLGDPELVEYLRAHRIPLEICPTSNVCVGGVPRLRHHPLPELLRQGLHVTINSDDPPMFDTTLNGEYLGIAETFGLEARQLEELVMNGVGATLLPETERENMKSAFAAEFARLRGEHLNDVRVV